MFLQTCDSNKPEIATLSDRAKCYIQAIFLCICSELKFVEILKKQELLSKPHQKTGNTVVEVKRAAARYLKEFA